jgi:VanZ family protein
MKRDRQGGVVAKRSRAIGIALLVYWCAMFLATHIKLPKVKSAPQNTDKLVHLAMYAGFAFLLSLWLSTRTTVTRRSSGFVLGAAILYAVLDELLQILTPTRTAQVWDFVMDVLGALLGLGMFWLFHRRFPSLWSGAGRRVHGDDPQAGLY